MRASAIFLGLILAVGCNGKTTGHDGGGTGHDGGGTAGQDGGGTGQDGGGGGSGVALKLLGANGS